MRELPILFNSEMVRAILDGRKTQTRRPVKPQPPSTDAVRAKAGIDFSIFRTNDSGPFRVAGPVWAVRDTMGCEPTWSPAYEVGDLLYVRETWALATGHAGDPCCAVRYQADGEIRALTVPNVTADFGSSLSTSDKWRPSIHMPKWAARIWLRVTGVRIERVRDITDGDAIAEGVRRRGRWVWSDGSLGYDATPARDTFGELWSEIYGAESWERNDWVWVYEFERKEAPR